jgi:trigger factor
MQVTVEDVNSVKKKIHVEIPREDVSKEIDSAYKNLKQKAKIKGYRPGKIPRSVLERLFKKDVHAEVIQNLVQTSFPEALKEADLAVLDTTDIDTPELDPDTEFKYNATVELRPQLPEVDFKGIKIKKTEYTVSDGEIEAQLEMLRKHLAEYHPITEDRPAAEGDYITIDYEGFKDGEPYALAPFTENHAIRMGEASFTEDFDKALAGMKPGDSREITVNFPADYRNAELSGQEVTFKVALKEIKQEVLPPFDDELAKKFGNYETLADLRKEIESNLQQGYDKRTNQEMQEQIFNKLLENEFEVPDVMVRHELDEIARDTEHRFSQNGLSMEQLGLTRELLDQQYRPVAEQQARRHLLLNKIIEQENLEVLSEDLDAEYAKLSEMIGQPLDFIRKFYQENPGKQDGFKIALLEKKAVDLIINHADVETVQPEDTKEEDDPAKTE